MVNTLREGKEILHNRYDMAAFAGKSPESTFKSNYCAEYSSRVNTEKHTFLLRCSPAKGDYNSCCYCYVKEWLDEHIKNAEEDIHFVDSGYKRKLRIPDGGKIIITCDWGEEAEKSYRYIGEYHTEVGSNPYHICEFTERMRRNRHICEPRPEDIQATKAPKKKEYGRQEGFKVAANPRAVRVLNGVLEVGSTDEKAIAAMTMGDILSMQRITAADIALINELQKSIEGNETISSLGGGTE